MNKLNQDLQTGQEVKINGKRFICQSGFGMQKDHAIDDVTGTFPDTDEVGCIPGMMIDVPKVTEPKSKSKSKSKTKPKIETESENEFVTDIPYNGGPIESIS